MEPVTLTPIEAIPLVIVDDEPPALEGLRAALACDPSFDVVGEAFTARDALLEIRRHDPAVALVDYGLPGETGAGLCRSIRRECPSVRILILTRHTSRRVIMDIFDGGAHGLVVKGVDPAGLRRAVRTVASGEVYIDPRIGGQIVAKALRSQRPRGSHGLTRQERRVLALVDRGLSTRAIADRLGLTVETVKTHLKHATRKLGVEGRRSAAEIVRDERLLGEDA